MYDEFIVIEPAPVVIETFVPAVSEANVYPDPFPINNCPFVGV